jgi:ABC-type antimicrobial peptide transport system permease subunit
MPVDPLDPERIDYFVTDTAIFEDGYCRKRDVHFSSVGMRRKRDIGVRLALGVDAGEIVRWVVGENVVLTLAGITAGIGTDLFLREAMDPFLFGIKSTDLATYLAAALLLFVIATAASLAAAMPVLRIDPAKTLRAE